METLFILKNHALVDLFFSLDNYVHRLVASKTDGKLVQYECEGDTCQEEKIDALQLEVRYFISNYTYVYWFLLF